MGSPVNTLSSNKVKNHIYNGAFNLFQRGTSIAVPAANNTYTADRWTLFSNSGQASTVSKQTHSTLPNSRSACRVQKNSGQTGSGNAYFAQCLESRDSEIFSSQNVSLSFRAKAGVNYSAASNLLVAKIYTTQTHIDLKFPNWGQYTTIPVNATLTTNMQNFNISGLVPAGTTQIAVLFESNFLGTAGANDWYQIEDVQLEFGQAATPFEHRGGSFTHEIQLCQRYYEKSYELDVTPGTATEVGRQAFHSETGSSLHNNNTYLSQKFAVTKRAVPSMSLYGSSVGGTSPRFSDASGTLRVASADQVGTTTYSLKHADGSSTSGFFWHFTADAEF